MSSIQGGTETELLAAVSQKSITY